MFSKTKVGEGSDTEQPAKPATPASGSSAAPASSSASSSSAPAAPKAKPAPSILSSDLQITGNLETSGDIQIEGRVDGDIRAHLLTVGEGATVKGEITADDVIVNDQDLAHISREVERLHQQYLELAAAADA